MYRKISSRGWDWVRLARGWGIVSGCYGFLGCMFVCGGHSAVVGGICGAGSGESFSFSFSAFFCRC